MAMSELSVKEIIRELAASVDNAIVEVAENDWGYDTDKFHDTASPENILALLAYVAELEKERDFLKSRENRVTQLVHDNQESWEILAEKYQSALEKISELESIRDTSEKLVRCKGRYHSEQNYRALAKLFGVTTPDLPPLDGESRLVRVELPAEKFCPAEYAGSQLWNETEIWNNAIEECANRIERALSDAGIECEVV
jgi:hypothetical protein